ncbi:MAG: hypothetical protein HQL54_13035 [Magnetococcales bacterium]|nr:hypothetical protein [Magnetococcales bacterium]MBF0622838.1 hypothetical protein [Magnetococcales bacterium]
MLLMARGMLARSSEVVAVNVEDLHFDKDGSGTITIRRSKTDKTGQGAIMWISQPTVQAVKDWLKVSGIKKGPLFQSLTKGGTLRGNRLATTDFYR